MKRIFYAVLLLTLILQACKKDKNIKSDKTDNGELYQLTFNTQLNTSIEDISVKPPLKTNGLKQNQLASSANEFLYKVFDTNGENVSVKTQTIEIAQENFGKIVDFLPAGTYTVLMVASNGHGLVQLYSSSIWFTYDFASIWNDTFYKKFSITVGNSGINENVTLNRVVGMIEVRLLDQLPSDVKVVEVTVNNDRKYYNFIKDLPEPETMSQVRSVRVTEATRNNMVIQIPVINTVDPMSVEIALQSLNNVVIAKKTVYYVSCETNRKTILTGHILSEAPGSGGFNVDLNHEFDNDVIEVPL